MNPTIVVLDGHPLDAGDNPWDPVARLGELTVYDRTSDDEIVERASGAEIVLTNKTPLRAGALERLEALRFISVLATGYDVVDVERAAELGIVVSNVPEYATDSVAQHVFALLCELTNHVALHDRAVRDGRWRRADQFSFWERPVVELAGRTLGVVGFGRIGRRVAEIGRALGMRVVAHTRSEEDAPDWEDFAWMEREELFESSDVVSLHCPLTEETAGMVDAGLLARTTDDAYLINTARGGLVDAEALRDALDAGALAGAAVDVVEREPIPADHPLLEAPRCLITPHMAWASLEARRRLMRRTAENIEAFLSGEPRNVVRAP
jgi:glycerate dehydrogenase